MRNINFTKYLKLIFFALCFNVMGFLFYRNDIQDVLNFIQYNYGYIDIWHINNVISILLWLLPHIVIIIYLGNFTDEYLLSNSTIIFTRTNKRSFFIIKSIIIILINIIEFYIIQFAILYILALFLNIKITFSYLIVVMLVKLILYDFIFVLLINIISLIYNSIIGAYASIISQIIMIYLLIISTQSNITIAKYLPISYVLFTLQNTNIQINISNSIIYFVIILFIEIIICVEIFKRKEFL